VRLRISHGGLLHARWLLRGFAAGDVCHVALPTPILPIPDKDDGCCLALKPILSFDWHYSFQAAALAAKKDIWSTMFQWILSKSFFRGWFDKSLDMKKSYLAGVLTADIIVTQSNQLIADNLTRASAMLTHISLMIALTGILWSLEEEGSGLVRWFGFELMGYIFLATLCVYCLSSVPPHLLEARLVLNADPTDVQDKVRAAVMDRWYVDDRILKCCRNALLFLTRVLLVTVFVAVMDLDPVIANWVNSTLSKWAD
jgi:hypothetical protein